MMDAVYKVITDLVIRLATRCLSILTGGKELCIEESFETSVVVDQKDHFLPISAKNESNTEINERFADLHHLSHPFRQAPQPPLSDATENILQNSEHF